MTENTVISKTLDGSLIEGQEQANHVISYLTEPEDHFDFSSFTIERQEGSFLVKFRLTGGEQVISQKDLNDLLVGYDREFGLVF